MLLNYGFNHVSFSLKSFITHIIIPLPYFKLDKPVFLNGFVYYRLYPGD